MLLECIGVVNGVVVRRYIDILIIIIIFPTPLVLALFLAAASLLLCSFSKCFFFLVNQLETNVLLITIYFLGLYFGVYKNKML